MSRSHLLVLFAAFLAAFALYPSVRADPTNVTACQVINVAGSYQFNQSINGSSDACIDISAGNVELDCRGNLLFGNLSTNSYGIRAGPANNVTLFNCQIKNFSVGIRIRTSSNVTIRNNSIWNSSNIGIELANEGAGRNNATHVYNNTVSYSGDYNIKAVDLDDGEFYNNRLYNASSYALLMQFGNRNNVTNNTIWNNSNYGIRTDTSENLTYLFNNTIFNNSGGGFTLIGSVNSIAYQNTVYNNTGYGIQLQSGLSNNVSYNNLFNQSSTGIRADTRENSSEINYNTVHENYGGGIFGGEAYLSNIRFNTVYNNTGVGIYIQGGQYINITNNSIQNSTNSQPAIRGDYLGLNFSFIESNYLYGTGGIAVLDSSTNTTIRNNTILNSPSGGVSLQNYVQNVTVFNNTITNFTSAGILVFDYSHDNYILNNTLENATGTDGIGSTQAAYRNFIQYNNVSFIYSGTGINLDNTTDNDVSNNRVINSTNLGIRINGYAHRNTVQYNTVSNMTSNPVSVWGLSENNTLTRNTVSFNYNSGNFAFRVENSSNNNVTHNVIFNVTSGIAFNNYANGNLAENNSIENHTSSVGISVSTVSNSNTVYLNNVTFSYGGQGIEVLNASYNNVSYNRVSNITATGIQLVTLATYNTVHDNFVTGQSGGSTYAYLVSNSTFNTLYNNGANYTQAGYEIVTNADNNTLRDSSAYFVTDYGIKINSVSDNNTLLRNLVVNHTNAAIRIDTESQSNYVLNNTLINGSNTGPITGYGIFLTGGATRNFVDYNNVSFDQANALVVSNGTYNTIRYNNFYNSTLQTAYLDELASYNTLLGNLFENASHRLLETSNASFNTFENNSFRYGQRLLLTTNATNNSFTNNTLEFLSASALVIDQQSHNNSFRDNDLLNTSGAGIILDRGSQDNYFYSNLVSNSTDYAAQIESSARASFFGDMFRDTGGSALEHVMTSNSTDVNFTNVTISSPLTILHFFLNRSSVVLLNVTFNKSRVDIVDSTSNLTVRWYVRPVVRTFEGAASVGSSLSVINTTAMNESAVSVSGTTGGDGSVATVALTEYFATSVYTNNVSSYNFSVNKSGALNSTLLSVTGTGDFVVLLNVPPVVSLSSPADSSVNASRTVNFSFVPSDVDSALFSNCSVWSNESSWGVKQANTSSIVNGSSNFIAVTFGSDGTFLWNVECYDRSNVGVFGSNRSVTIDSVAPSGFGFVVPSADNGSTVTENYTEINVTFTEGRPDSCLLEFNNGSVVNYSMTRSGNSCYRNHTVSNNGDFNYTVYANDSAGNWGNSSRRFLTFTDDATPPSVSLSSPVDSAALSSLSSLVFSFSDAVSVSASCVVFLDGSSVYSNASVLNGTSTSASVVVSQGVHVWNASCTDVGGNQGNSSIFTFSLSSSGGSSAPVPTVTPSVTPEPSTGPVASVEPSVEPSVGPEMPVVTEEPVEVVVVPLEEVSSVSEPVVLESGAQGGEGVVVTTSLLVSSVAVPSGDRQRVSRVLFEVKNVGSLALRDLRFTRHFRDLECLGSDPAAYEAVGVVFSPRPLRIECGSAVVTWLFDNVEPGEAVKAEASVPKELSKKDVSEGIATPRVIARSAEAARATPAATATVVPSAAPTPGGFDWTLPALGVLVLLGVGAYFVFGRKPQGL